MYISFFFLVCICISVIFFSLSHENLNVYITFVFFFFHVFLHFYTHTIFPGILARTRSRFRSLTFVLLCIRSLLSFLCEYFSCLRVSLDRKIHYSQFFVHALFKISSLCNCTYNVIPHFSFYL